jgi:hypothetical protein
VAADRTNRAVGKVALVRAEVVVGVDRDGGVEVLLGEGKIAGVGAQRINEILAPGPADRAKVLGGRDVAVRCPHARAELAGEEDRAYGAPASEVEEAVAPAERDRARECPRLGEGILAV